MHISDDLPHNNKPTEAGGLGLCVDGTTCLHTYTVYICIMIPFHIWHWKKQTTGGRWGGGRQDVAGEFHSSSDNTTFLGRIQQTARNTNFPVKRLFFSGVKETTNVWEVLPKTLWYMLLREVDGLDYITRQTACINSLAKSPLSHWRAVRC